MPGASKHRAQLNVTAGTADHGRLGVLAAGEAAGRDGLSLVGGAGSENVEEYLPLAFAS